MERGGGHQNENGTLIGYLLHLPLLRIEPKTQACAPTFLNPTGNLWVHGMMSNPLNHTGQGTNSDIR